MSHLLLYHSVIAPPRNKPISAKLIRYGLLHREVPTRPSYRILERLAFINPETSFFNFVGHAARDLEAIVQTPAVLNSH